jgi:chemotaxis receptor (MCP) glutamine deamidase CheD
MISGQVRRVSIHIGGVYASRTPAVISTVLGSCVAVCLFDPAASVGGMNHIFLPEAPRGDALLPTRYGLHAMETLINQIMKLGGDRRRLRAKVFGGGRVLRLRGALSQVGERNARFVEEFLSEEQIPLVGKRIGGETPVKLYFFTDSARALVKPVAPQTLLAIAERESRYSAQLSKKVEVANGKQDDVVLF